MIPNILGLLLGVSLLQAVYGAAYSKIYVQSGAEVVPVEYVNYGAPRVFTNKKIAALSAPPIGSTLPLPNLVTPCVAPCVFPTQTVETLVPAFGSSNAKIVSYNTPSVPAVVDSANDEKSTYEYSYVVYDEDTGDKKAQRELSDGSVVHGEYSFIQPDGYIREVKYTADDLTGFNAVVKSFLPESVEKKKPEVKDKSEQPPCIETKSEALKVEPNPEKPQSEVHGELAVVPVTIHEAEVKQTQSGEKPAIPKAEHISVLTEHSYKHGAEQSPEQKSKHSKLQSNHFIIHVNETPEEHAKHGDHPVEVGTHPTEYKNSLPDQSAADHAAKQNAEKSPNLSPAVELIHISTTEDCDDKTHTHENVQATIPPVSTLNGLATYNDIIKCIQSAITTKDSSAPSISPLTYIILPEANKPC